MTVRIVYIILYCTINLLYTTEVYVKTYTFLRSESRIYDIVYGLLTTTFMKHLERDPFSRLLRECWGPHNVM